MEFMWRDVAIDIESELANTDLTYTQIAKKYNVDENFVRDIDRENHNVDSYSFSEEKTYDYLYDEHRVDYDPQDW
jgi:hypothetical protein